MALSAWRMALGWSPLLMWLAFSLFYYGFPFPNTAYAKLNDAIPLGPRLAQGFYYLWNSLRWDPLTLATIGVAIIMGCWLLRVRRSASASDSNFSAAADTDVFRRDGIRSFCVSLGILFYLIYIIRIGGDFMSGRYLTAPLFCAVCILSRLDWLRVSCWAPAGVVVLVLGLLSLRPLAISETGFDLAVDPQQIHKIIAEHGVCDERAFYYHLHGLASGLEIGRPVFPGFPVGGDGEILRDFGGRTKRKDRLLARQHWDWRFLRRAERHDSRLVRALGTVCWRDCRRPPIRIGASVICCVRCPSIILKRYGRAGIICASRAWRSITTV